MADLRRTRSSHGRVRRAQRPGGTGRPYGAFDAYVRDLRTGGIVRASAAERAGRDAGVAPGLALSGDGTRVALTRVHGGPFNFPAEVVVVDLPTGEVRSAARPASSGVQQMSLSADGDRVAFGGHHARVKVLSSGRTIDMARPPGPSFRERFVDSAVPGPWSLQPLRDLLPWS